SLWDVAKRMIEHQIDGMPVVQKGKNGRLKVVGRVTKTNITKAFVHLGADE
ncbi:CBS domain-containing protein, partial [Acidaminococcus intestini]|uniref:CBS domain-containing protein n=1 Tax=Acidaminococcus intestini TaxID=187327 RepID=UPI003AB28B36